MPNDSSFAYRKMRASYVPNKSMITLPCYELEDLLEKYSFYGEDADKRVPGEIGCKERVDFGRQLGLYLYKTDTGEIQSAPTTIGIIHYDGKGGGYIIPAKPKSFDEEKAFKS